MLTLIGSGISEAHWDDVMRDKEAGESDKIGWCFWKIGFCLFGGDFVLLWGGRTSRIMVPP